MTQLESTGLSVETIQSVRDVGMYKVIHTDKNVHVQKYFSLHEEGDGPRLACHLTVPLDCASDLAIAIMEGIGE